MKIDCFRRFWKTIGPLYNAETKINLSSLKIADAGNVYKESSESGIQSLENVLNSLAEVAQRAKQKNPSGLIVTLGGTKEASYATCLGVKMALP